MGEASKRRRAGVTEDTSYVKEAHRRRRGGAEELQTRHRGGAEEV